MPAVLPNLQTGARKIGCDQVGRGGYGGSNLVACDYFDDNEERRFNAWANQAWNWFQDLHRKKGKTMRKGSSDAMSPDTRVEEGCESTARLIRDINAGKVTKRDWADWAQKLNELPGASKSKGRAVRRLVNHANKDGDDPKRYIADVKLAWRRSYLASSKQGQRHA
jgi:hypothetical protein